MSILDHPLINTKTKKAGWAAVLAIAIPLVGNYEGLFLHPYRDVVGVKTVCYGATAADHVDLSRSYTKAECDKMLGDDLPKYDAMIQKCLTKEAYNALPPHRHAALVSFVYNLGPGSVCSGGVGRDLNRGNVSAACHDMLAYDHAGGRRIKGLTIRRQSEYKLCMEND
jgi:lysozyme